jgi:hypothetical protein
MEGLGTHKLFTPNTIDKPGKGIAAALHGKWMAPLPAYNDPDADLLIGVDPYTGFQGIP